MKKILIFGVLCMSLAIPAMADMQVNVTYDTTQYSGAVDGVIGGEFRATPIGWSGNLSLYDSKTKTDTTFQTFCIERKEYFTAGTTYGVDLRVEAMAGGGNDGPIGPAGGDPISVGTAFLYQQFATGQLTGYNYTYGSGRTTTAGELQIAFWILEDEDIGPSYSMADWIVTALKAEFGATSTLADWQADNYKATSPYAVMVMNLHNSPQGVQDMLVLVPVPGAMLLGFLGLGYAGMRLRKVA